MSVFLTLLFGFLSLQNVTAFVNVNVLPMDEERILENQTVLVRNDRIINVGPAGEIDISQDVHAIDGTGKYLMPGLAEMHGHIPPPTQPQEDIENVLFLYAANGITTVRGMLGWPGQLALREQVRRGELTSPMLYLAGPSFNGNSISSPEQAARRVKRQVDQGWDLLKVHPGLTRAEYDAMARRAHEEGIAFGGHVPADVGLMHALDMGQETFDHIDGFTAYLNAASDPLDRDRLDKAVNRTRDAGAWIVPTLVLWETILGVGDLATMRQYEELKYVRPATVQNWIRQFESRRNNPQFNPVTAEAVARARLDILIALHEGGVPILMGTDAPQQFSVPGFSLHREMERMVQAGMTPYEVLRAGTVNVGRYFEDRDTFGLVAEGHRADLILLAANPFEDVSNLADLDGVMLAGSWMDASHIQKQLDVIERAYRGN